jgi:hypothetical protein
VKWVECIPSPATPRLAVPLSYSRPDELRVLAPRHLELVKTVLALSGVEVELHAFLTSILGEDKLFSSLSRPDLFIFVV